MEFKDRLNRLMKEKGITGYKIDKNTSISKQSVSQYLSGTVPSSEKLKELAENIFKYPEASIAFALNHTSAHKTTSLYYDNDFSLVDEMNRKIINYVFYRRVNALLLRKSLLSRDNQEK